MKCKVLAFYSFQTIENPEEMVKQWKEYLSALNAKGRIYINHEGINAQMSVPADADCDAWVLNHFPDADIKVQYYDEQPFDRLKIKLRKQLVALDMKVDMEQKGAYLTPTEWKKVLEEQDENTYVLDIRNDYEWEVGHFENAIRPPASTFRKFPPFAEKLAQELPKNARILMYCTGGIRCELFSPLLKSKGFDNVYQLHGGVIKYGLEEGSSHWKGKLFVFDDRLTVPISNENSEVISHCSHCEKQADTYYNCANMDCNELFISCKECAIQLNGCCSEECTLADRVRPFDPEQKAKPFRKLSFEEKQQYKSLCCCNRNFL